VSSGVPATHLVRAAIRAAGLIDSYGSPVPAADAAFLLYPSDGLYPPQDLRLGERLLVDCGLLAVMDDQLVPTYDLKTLAELAEPDATAIVFELAVRRSMGATSSPVNPEIEAAASVLVPDPERREALLIAMARRHDESVQTALGARGEDFVVSVARDELRSLGRQDLAERVRRVSKMSDQLGYDVVAPRIGGTRRLEVKTSVATGSGLFRFYLSRAEYEVGLVDSEWALVGCHEEDDAVSLAGWCRATLLDIYLPADGQAGRWVSAEVSVPVALLKPGLPPVA
jgi:Protein NO VEIN, C-terminal